MSITGALAYDFPGIMMLLANPEGGPGTCYRPPFRAATKRISFPRGAFGEFANSINHAMTPNPRQRIDEGFVSSRLSRPTPRRPPGTPRPRPSALYQRRYTSLLKYAL